MRFLKRLALALLLPLAGVACHHAPPPDALPGGAQLPRKIQQEEADNRRRLAGEAFEQDRRLFGFPAEPFYKLVVDIPVKLYRRLNGEATPLTAAVAMEDPKNPDNRRFGILKLAGYPFGRQGQYVTRYEQIAALDPDPTVRAAAVRAMDRSRDRKPVATNQYLKALESDEQTIRLEGAKALANVPDDKAVGPLIAHLNNANENKDVRISCADALRNFKTLEVGRALVGTLQDRDFGVSWQARQSLALATHHDFGYDEQAWLGYLTGSDKPFK